ncbi:hypothetical protein [Streptomyces inhibens]|uniref:hypothetical protein n=1 Tax=Streptomyces inhibens TaxID=2293571 RepID=UPI0011C1A22B|nr:hypothetical protein [Streptomyces inhibens]
MSVIASHRTAPPAARQGGRRRSPIGIALPDWRWQRVTHAAAVAQVARPCVLTIDEWQTHQAKSARGCSARGWPLLPVTTDDFSALAGLASIAGVLTAESDRHLRSVPRAGKPAIVI